MLLAQVWLKPKHRSTGFTRHIVYGSLMPRPAQLKVEQFDGDPGFLLLYCTVDGDELSDTYHETLQAAFRQAQNEFEVDPGEWTLMKP